MQGSSNCVNSNVVEPRVIFLDVLYSLRVIPLEVELCYVQFFRLCTCGPTAVLHIFIPMLLFMLFKPTINLGP